MIKPLSIRSIFLLLVILLFSLSIRLFHVTLIPVFADEAIYIRWSQVMRAESSLRFLPLSDGKQPLFMWATIPFLKLISDPLMAGRLVSILSGLSSIAAIAVLTYLLTQNTGISLIAALLGSLSPFMFFFDRLALVDSMLATFGIWTFIFALITARTFRLDSAMLTGFFLGFALLTKSPGMIFAILLPLPFILFRQTRVNHKYIVKVVGLLLASYIIGFAMYNILRLGPQFHMITARNKDYVFSFPEVLNHPLFPLFANLRTSFSYFWYFLTPPVFSLVILSIFRKKINREPLFLWGLFLLPIIAQSLIAKVYTARYLVFVVPYAIILAAIGLNRLTSSNVVTKIFSSKSKPFLCFFLLVWPVVIIAKLLINPQDLSLPRSERSGYFELWTAGYGIQESAKFLQEKSKEGTPILIGTEGYFGTLPNGLEIYLNGNSSIRVIGVGFPDRIPDALSNSFVDNDVYLIANDSRLLISDRKKLQLIASYPKATQPNGQIENLLLYHLISR